MNAPSVTLLVSAQATTTAAAVVATATSTDWATLVAQIIVAFIGASPALIVALRAVKKIETVDEKVVKIDADLAVVHTTTNSMSEALAAAKLKEGEALGITAEKTRKALEEAQHAASVKEGHDAAMAELKGKP